MNRGLALVRLQGQSYKTFITPASSQQQQSRSDKKGSDAPIQDAKIDSLESKMRDAVMIRPEVAIVAVKIHPMDNLLKWSRKLISKH